MRVRLLLLALIFAVIPAIPVAHAATVHVTGFGDEGWKSDDTRSSTGVDLVGVNYTHYGKPGQTPTSADDATIANQIQFVYSGPDAVSCLRMAKIWLSGFNSKCTLSKIEEGGIADAADLATPAFFANYRYYSESTAEATVLKLGVRSMLWGTSVGQSQNGFTATRSGESAWDLILVDWRGTNPPWTVGAWDTFTTDQDTDCWMVYRQGGNNFFNPPPGVAKSLADWASDTGIACTISGTPYTWGQVLFGAGAKVASVQFGVGSSAQTSNTYIDWIETSLLNDGDRVEFDGPPPPVHNVTQDTYYNTIQAAVVAANPGDEIAVAAGTYNETVSLQKSLHLIGAGAGTTTWRGTTITQRSLQITRNNSVPANIDVEIAGFRFECENNQSILGNWSTGYTEALTMDVHDNSFGHVNSRNPGDDFAMYIDGAVQTPRGAEGAIRIHDNTFDLITGGILCENCRAVDVLDNTFVTTYEAVTFNYYSNASACGEQFVAGNTFTYSHVAWGFAMNNWHGAGTYTILPSEVRNNAFVGGFSYAIAYGVEATQASTHVFSIADNSISQGTINVWGPFASEVTLNASGNWWGSAASPSGRISSGRADFTPWLGVGTDTSTDPGFQGDFSTLWVDDNSPQTGTAGRIQEAINLVSGSTVNVAAGLYEEQIEIDQPLNLVGAGASTTTIRSPLSLPLYFTTVVNGTPTQNHPIVYVHDTDGAAISGLKIDGYGRGNANYRFDGIAYYNAGGSVSACNIVDVRDTPFSGAQHGVAFYAYAPVSPARSLAISNCQLSGYQKNGMALNGSYLSVSVDGCTVTGAGPTAVTAQNGIQIGSGAGGSIGATAGNTVTGHSYTPHNWAACGILVMDATGTVAIEDNSVSQNSEGIYVYNTTATVSGNVVTATQAGTGVPDYCAIFCDPGEGGRPAQGFDAAANDKGGRSAYSVTLSGNNLTGTGGTNSVGTWIYAGTGKNLAYSATNEIINGFDYGILAQEAASNLITAASITSSSIYGNASYGVYNSAAALFDADDNWWGDETGPQHPDLNSDGTGNAVSDNVSFDPYRSGNIVLIPDPMEISVADAVAEEWATIRYLGGLSGPLYGYSLKLQFPSEIDLTQAVRPLTGPFAGAALFQAVDQGSTWYIDAALGGGNPGTVGPCDLARVKVKGLSCTSTGAVLDLTVQNVRDSNNQPLTGAAADSGLVLVDLGAPTVTAGTFVRTNLPNTGYVKNGDTMVLTAAIGDTCSGVLLSGITADLSSLGGGAAVAPATYAAGVATWTLPVNGTGVDGNRTVSVTATDGLGNTTTLNPAGTVYLDNTKPAVAVSTLTASPSHNEIGLAWTNPSGDPDLDTYGVMIRRVGWGDYPNYATAAPAYPDSVTGTRVLHGTGMPTSFFDVTFAGNWSGRDIYYYQAFVFDKAYNYGGGGGGARATSYWLGDVDNRADPDTIGNGTVTFSYDVTALSACYYKAQGDPIFNEHCDVGPTHNGSRLGIPTPDNFINFEDLMIFSMNYGVVAPIQGSATGLLTCAVPPTLSLRAPSAQNAGILTASLVLQENHAVVKGLHSRITYDAQRLELVRVEKGALTNLDGVFFASVPQTGAVVIDASQLGEGLAFAGSGEVATLTFRVRGAARPVLAEAGLRDAANRVPGASEEIVEGGAPSAPAEAVARTLPTRLEFSGALPNPFVGRTDLRLALPTEAAVTLRIFDVNGRLVRTLADGVLPAGEHRLSWDGRSDDGERLGAGIYFADFRTSGLTETRKLFLMR